MRLTTKGRYAVTAMLDLVLHDTGVPVCVSAVAERQGISQSYLEQLFARLRKRGLVASLRGPGGGYVLGRPAAEIAVSDVIAAVDERVDSTRCGGQANCHNHERCLTHDLWEGMNQRIHEFLNSVSLAELACGEGVRAVARRQDGHMTRHVTFTKPVTALRAEL